MSLKQEIQWCVRHATDLSVSLQGGVHFTSQPAINKIGSSWACQDERKRGTGKALRSSPRDSFLSSLAKKCFARCGWDGNSFSMFLWSGMGSVFV